MEKIWNVGDLSELKKETKLQDILSKQEFKILTDKYDKKQDLTYMELCKLYVQYTINFSKYIPGYDNTFLISIVKQILSNKSLSRKQFESILKIEMAGRNCYRYCNHDSIYITSIFIIEKYQKDFPILKDLIIKNTSKKKINRRIYDPYGCLHEEYDYDTDWENPYYYNGDSCDW